MLRPLGPNKTGFNLIILLLNIRGKLSIIRCNKSLTNLCYNFLNADSSPTNSCRQFPRYYVTHIGKSSVTPVDINIKHFYRFIFYYSLVFSVDIIKILLYIFTISVAFSYYYNRYIITWMLHQIFMYFDKVMLASG